MLNTYFLDNKISFAMTSKYLKTIKCFQSQSPVFLNSIYFKNKKIEDNIPDFYRSSF